MPDDQPGVYIGALDPGISYGKCFLNVSYASFDTADDADSVPEKRLPSSATLTITPNVNGAVIGPSAEIILISPTTLNSTDGHFEFWCIDGNHSSYNPSGWNWNARLTVSGVVVASFNFTPDSSISEPVNLGTFFPLTNPATGTVLLPGPPPSVEWSGDQLIVGGKIGPHLTGGGGSGGVTSYDDLTDKPNLVVNIRDLGAVGDGVADDTAAFTAAQTALAGGGLIYLPAGEYLTDPIELDTGQFLEGAGYDCTVIKAKPNSSGPVVGSKGFAALVGTDTSVTPQGLGVRHLTIDGNKTNQTNANHGIGFYANGCSSSDFVVRNCKGKGIYSEWGTSTPAGAPTIENFFTNYRVVNCDEGSHECLGPHDSQFLNFVSTKNGVTGSGVADIEIPLDGKANGCIFSHYHIWGGTYDHGIHCAASGVRFLEGQVEGGNISQVRISASMVEALGQKLFAGGVNEATTKAVIIDNNSSNVRIHAKVENCGGGIVDFTTSGGNHDIDIHAQYYGDSTLPASPIVGNIPSGSKVNILTVPPNGIPDPNTTTFITPGSVSAAGGKFKIDPTTGYVGQGISPNSGISYLMKPANGNKGISVAAADSDPDDLINFTSSSFTSLARVTAGGDIRTAQNLTIGTLNALDGNGKGVIGLANATSVPGTPESGIVLFAQDGIPKFLQGDGSIVTIPSNIPTPAAPTGLSVVSSTQGSLTATWDAVPDAVGYTVSLDGTPLTVTSTTYTWTGLDPSSQHNVSVHAVMGLASADTTASGTVADPPVQPALSTLIAAQSPVVWFPLNDAPGTTNPQQQGSSPVIVNGAAGSGAPTYDGVSALFGSGTDHCISFHGYDWVGKTSFAFECVIGGWCDPGTQFLEADNLLMPKLNGTDGMRLNFITDAATAYTAVKDGEPGATPTNAKHHIACSWDGTSYSQYFDGVLAKQQYSDTYAIGGALKQTAAEEIYIGAALGSACGTTLSDVVFYDHTLTAEEIANHAAAAL